MLLQENCTSFCSKIHNNYEIILFSDLKTLNLCVKTFMMKSACMCNFIKSSNKWTTIILQLFRLSSKHTRSFTILCYHIITTRCHITRIFGCSRISDRYIYINPDCVYLSKNSLRLLLVRIEETGFWDGLCGCSIILPTF